MGQITVGISDMAVSGDSGDTIVTYALGSCIAVVVWDPVRKVGGMIHYMLSLSRTSPDKAKTKPAMFADTGVPLLFKQMYARSCQKSDLVVKVAGGGKLYDDNGTFDIGRPNYVVVCKLFWKNDVVIAAEGVGGGAPAPCAWTWAPDGCWSPRWARRWSCEADLPGHPRASAGPAHPPRHCDPSLPTRQRP